MKPVPPTSVSIMVQVFRVVFSSMPIRDFTSQGVQNNQYQRNHNNAYNRSKGRQLRLIKICLICYMLRNRNVIFFPAESAKHRACHNHGNRTAQNTGIAMTRPVIPRAQTAFSSPNFFTIVTANSGHRLRFPVSLQTWNQDQPALSDLMLFPFVYPFPYSFSRFPLPPDNCLLSESGGPFSKALLFIVIVPPWFFLPPTADKKLRAAEGFIPYIRPSWEILRAENKSSSRPWYT